MTIPKIANIAILAILLGLSVSSKAAGTEDHVRAVKRTNDFTDFLKSRINPTDEDYGKKVQEYSARVLEQTLENVYFWTTVLSLLSATTLSLWLVHLLQQRQRRELISARFLAWYHNELVMMREEGQSPPALYGNPSADSDRAADNGAGDSPIDTGKSEKSFAAGVPVSVAPTAETATESKRLRQKITAFEDNEKVLRDQINVLTRRLQEEKQKNRSLSME